MSVDKKIRFQRLKSLCVKYFGKDYEWWSWDVSLPMSEDSDTQTIIKAAIELPKVRANGESDYTDPFIASSGGEIKSKWIAAGAAIEWLEQAIFSEVLEEEFKMTQEMRKDDPKRYYEMYGGR